MSDLRSKLTVIIERQLDIINDGKKATPVINNANETLTEIIALVREQIETETVQRCIDAAERLKWISVKDRLPQKSGYYLVATDGFYKSERAHIERYSADENLHWYGIRDVTHWMPLPELPEAQK